MYNHVGVRLFNTSYFTPLAESCPDVRGRTATDNLAMHPNTSEQLPNRRTAYQCTQRTALGLRSSLMPRYILELHCYRRN